MEQEVTLDQNILDILGPSEQEPRSPGLPIPIEIAQKWEVLLKRGLSVEDKQALLQKYRIPSNCPSAFPPKLNPEVKAAVNETALKRDQRLEKTQSQMGASLAALGQALSWLIQPEENGQRLKIIEALSDGARLLADIHHEHSISRQNVISTNLDKSVKLIIENVELDGWLFGENLNERMKNAKQIEKSAEELKYKTRPVKKVHTEAKNVRYPPRQPVLGGSQFSKRQMTSARVRQQRRDQPQHYYQKRVSEKTRFRHH